MITVGVFVVLIAIGIMIWAWEQSDKQAGEQYLQKCLADIAALGAPKEVARADLARGEDRPFIGFSELCVGRGEFANSRLPPAALASIVFFSEGPNNYGKAACRDARSRWAIAYNLALFRLNPPSRAKYCRSTRTG